MEHRVITYSGSFYAEEPREFCLGDDYHTVSLIEDTWLEQTLGLENLTRRVWRVLDENGKRYRLTYYQSSDFWEIEADP